MKNYKICDLPHKIQQIFSFLFKEQQIPMLQKVISNHKPHKKLNQYKVKITSGVSSTRIHLVCLERKKEVWFLPPHHSTGSRGV